MTSLSQKIIKPKLGLLELAKHLGNVSQACKTMGYSRDTFYRYKELYESGGEAALQEISRKKPIEKNRVPAHVEDAVLAMALDNPALGQYRVSNELKLKGIIISGGGVRSVWLRNNLETFKKRLVALEKHSALEGVLLTESQLKCLEKLKDKKEALGEIETEHPGYLISQDTYYVGNMKGVGKIYQQTVIDTYSRVAFAHLYTEKNALTAAHMLNLKVLPWFSEQDISVLRVLTDRGTEYCGKVESHAYQLYLGIENIDHSKTKAYSPQTNGIVERFHKTMKNEFYDIAFRKKLYANLEELQQDVDIWLKEYNELRPHSGKYCYGKTPMQTFISSKSVSIEKELDNNFIIGQNETYGNSEATLTTAEVNNSFTEIAPQNEFDNIAHCHGAKQKELENEAYLSDNNL